LGFFTAGHETSSSTLGWAALELSRRPKIVEKLRQEIDPLFADSDDETNVAEQICRLKYLECFIKETQRFHTVVSLSQRIATKHVSVLGYEFEAGDIFNVNIAGLHADSEYWENPNDFVPERFELPIVPGSFLPFSDGPHKCIGFKLAMSEMKVIDN
jgi:cytochrome P450